jgi:hypothetical protein
LKSLVVQAVTCKPISPALFPVLREDTGKFTISDRECRLRKRKSRDILVPYLGFPYLPEQGMIRAIIGKQQADNREVMWGSWQEQGSSCRAG